MVRRRIMQGLGIAAIVCAVILSIFIYDKKDVNNINQKQFTSNNTKLTSGFTDELKEINLSVKDNVNQKLASIETNEVVPVALGTPKNIIPDDLDSKTEEITETVEEIKEDHVVKINKIGYIKEPTNIRTEPNLESEIFTVYNTNKKIKYGNYDSSWVKIKYEDGYAYVAASQISDKKVKISKPHSTTKLIYTAHQFKRLGNIHWGGRRWTYYSQRVLPGGGLIIPGRHVDENGYVCDGDNNICGASQLLSKGTVIDSPFGKKVKIYDWCDIESVDIYTNW